MDAGPDSANEMVMMSFENRFRLFGIMLRDRPGGAHIGA